MRIFLIAILLGQLSFAAELGIVLSKKEVQNLNNMFSEGEIHEKFTKLLSDFKPDISCTFKEESNEIYLTGKEEQLKLAEYLYILCLKDFSEVEFKFSHFEGSPLKREVKRQFTKKLTVYKGNKFQFSNKLLNNIGNDINGFSFYVLPNKDRFQKNCELTVRLSYKNEDLKIGDKGTQLLDLNTTLSMASDKEYIIKVSDARGAGWNRNTFLSFELSHSLQGHYFKEHIPRDYSYEGGIIRTLAYSNSFLNVLGHNPQNYFEKLGVKFTDWGFIKINKRQQELIIYNSKENMQLFDEVLRYIIPSDFNPNITTNISIFESNLIIKDTDKLEGHRLKKISTFSTLCSEGHNFLLSKSFNGDYESAVFMNVKMPFMDNKFKYELTLKTPGPKSKAKNFKLEGNFANSKKYRVHLDEHHFMEVQIQK